MESGERLGIGVAHSVEAAGGAMNGTKEAQVTVVCLRYAGDPSECGERPILPVDSDGVAINVSGGPKKRPGI
ncbi:uncharacterized protein N7529_003825 [Penicillium soppii]|jgi:hypothetical protein|uniref:uncharacterized protein n=1 Tax=Penicillium soppii TaxID=69789 RepID=UPI002547258E|nr:uncharacterized protein N7529_003825 [Penicillium soppii]KAJ5871472.1 hypothetical protein N7529_003825 [Penicillium soppii]